METGARRSSPGTRPNIDDRGRQKYQLGRGWKMGKLVGREQPAERHGNPIGEPGIGRELS